MKIKKHLQKVISIAVLIIAIIPNTVFAQPQTIPEKTKPNIDDLLYKYESGFTDQPTTTDYIASLPEEQKFGELLAQVIFYLLIVANILAFISFLIAGVMMIISQGNDEELSKAKRIFTYTIIALVVCATALALVTGVSRIQFFNP
jgi:hypothetical protein